MLETAIVGGGLCGILLARSLRLQRRSFALFEARGRLGGRILSVPDRRSGMALDLGPTWFWPDRQPRIVQLVAELQLADFPQHDKGEVLHLRGSDKKPEVVGTGGVHNGARRLEGGMASLIDALARDLAKEQVHLDHLLTAVQDRGDHVALTFRVGQRTMQVEAERVVLALPPRLVEEHVAFEPGLDEATRNAMREAATWMAAQAKVVMSYDRRVWREAGQSGNAFVTHEQAVVGEIYDACDRTGEAALGGFLALNAELRQSFAVGLPMLMESQMVQVFGAALAAAGEAEQHYQDWATEPYTCSALDRTAPATEHAGFANPMLRRPLWGGKLQLGGSETATYGTGYLEGAVDAARRIDRALKRAAIAQEAVALREGDAVGSALINATSLARFSDWVAAQNDAAFDSYHQRLHRSLASQQREQLTQRAILGSVEEVYKNALGVLDSLPFDMKGVTAERGRSALTPEVQKPFRDFMQGLLDDVIGFNRTSCALSNFPGEHHPSKEYVQAILRDIAAAWQEFSLSANRLLLEKGRKAQDRGPADGRLSRGAL
jgi:monoamine oxidase